MEDILMSWSLETTVLEPLQPLSPSTLDDQESSISLDKLSRSEIAGKLLDHLDQITDEQETEPFDWFATEKSLDLPIFDNFISPIQNGIQNNLKPAAVSNYTYFDSPEYEPTFASSNYAFGTAAPEAIQSQLTYTPSLDANIRMACLPNDTVASIPTTFNTDVEVKKEVLTPPESPKDEEIMKLLEEIEPVDWENLVFDEKSDVTNVSSISENSCSVDESSDYAASSPYVPSESGSDDMDYIPRGARRMSRSTDGSTAKHRNPKPYSRQSIEERKLRKKEQNKNAATRYRMKKKQEVEEYKSEERQLAEKNKELRNKLDDISREIKCLKSLMRDVYRKKGLIS